MNPQPYQTPPNWWPSRLSPKFVKATRFWRRRDLRRIGIQEIDVIGGNTIKKSLARGASVLLLPNHSFHYDSHILIEAGLRSGWHTHFMTAWQVFGMSGTLGKHFLQRHGCFSINREGMDTKAIRHAISLLCDDPHALTIFSEGDIYHSNDRVMPFREGAAAIAIKAAKKSERPVHVIPCAMKCFYTKDPTPELTLMMSRLEERIRWRPRPDLPLLDRIYRFGRGFLASKEIEYIGAAQPGQLPERLAGLVQFVLNQVRAVHRLNERGSDHVEQIRNIRSFLIREIETIQNEQSNSKNGSQSDERLEHLQRHLDDMFFATQLTSYRGNYTSENPTIERIAETIDKFEEDIFELDYPTPRGLRRAVVNFGQVIDLSVKQFDAPSLTRRAEQDVQSLLDGINLKFPSNPVEELQESMA